MAKEFEVEPSVTSGYAAWLKTRPECVQKLAAEFPPGTIIEHEGHNLAVFGYTEDDVLIVTASPPGESYVALRRHIHAAHLRDGVVKFRRPS